jgi:hypothetical protein
MMMMRREKRFNMNLILVNPNDPPPSPDIIFECSDVRRDTGLILLKRTKNSNNDKFELHLYNDYTKKSGNSNDFRH